MAKLEISIPAVAHVIVTGVSNPAQKAVMQRIQDMLREEFGATVTVALPDGPAGTADDVKKALWVVSSA